MSISYGQTHIGITIDYKSDSITKLTIMDSTNYNFLVDGRDQRPDIFQLEFLKDSLIKVDFSHLYFGLVTFPNEPLKTLFKGYLNIENNKFKLSFYYIESEYKKPFYYLLNGYIKGDKIIFTGFNSIRIDTGQYVYLFDDRGEKLIFKDSYFILPYDEYVRKTEELFNRYKKK